MLAMLNKYRQLQDERLPDAAHGLRCRRRRTTSSSAWPRKVELQGFGLAGPGGLVRRRSRSRRTASRRSGTTCCATSAAASRAQATRFPVRANGDYYKIGVRRATRIFAQNIDRRRRTTCCSYSRSATSPRPRRCEGTDVPGARAGGPGGRARARRGSTTPASAACAARPTSPTTTSTTARRACAPPTSSTRYNGAPDRYDWKLVGKREMYIPYNAYKLSDKTLKYKDIIRKNTLERRPACATSCTASGWSRRRSRPGSRHVYGKRVVLPRRGQLERGVGGRLRHAQAAVARQHLPGMIQFYDAKVPWYRANIWHDLNNGGYLLADLDNEIREPIQFNVKGRVADFQPDALRGLGGTL
ncbi:MAG: DUF1329 domain-containing protein [Chromatiales bacterium]|nr:DUF1329 domain-containing protein [Chromatiales bacterium]